MATAREVIRVSLRYIGLETRNRQASPQDYNDSLRQLNQMLQRWYKLGLRAAYNTNPLTNLEDQMPYPDDAFTAIEYSLARQLWKFFSLKNPMPADFALQEEEERNDLWVLYAPNPKTVYPGTLPIGSGNYDCYDPFYPDCGDSIYSNCDKNELTTQSKVVLTGVDHADNS